MRPGAKRSTECFYSLPDMGEMFSTIYRSMGGEWDVVLSARFNEGFHPVRATVAKSERDGCLKEDDYFDSRQARESPLPQDDMGQAFICICI